MISEAQKKKNVEAFENMVKDMGKAERQPLAPEKPKVYKSASNDARYGAARLATPCTLCAYRP